MNKCKQINVWISGKKFKKQKFLWINEKSQQTNGESQHKPQGPKM